MTFQQVQFWVGFAELLVPFLCVLCVLYLVQGDKYPTIGRRHFWGILVGLGLAIPSLIILLVGVWWGILLVSIYSIPFSMLFALKLGEKAASMARVADIRPHVIPESAFDIPSEAGFIERVFRGDIIPDYMMASMKRAALHLYEDDTSVLKTISEYPPSWHETSEYPPAEQRLTYLVDTIREMFSGLHKPAISSGPFMLPLLELFPDPKGAVGWFAWHGRYNEYHDISKGGMFLHIKKHLCENWLAASTPHLSKKAIEEGARIKPAEYKGTPLETAHVYLGNTPFLDILMTPVPYGFPEATRFRHQWVVGDTGSGKTTFLSAMIADDLVRVAKNEASIFVMDSQNQLIPDIARLQLFAPGQPLHGKLIYLEPDPDYPLALNIFDVNRERTGTLSAKDRLMFESGAMWMVEFFLSSLVKAEASPHQDTFLNYVIPALMAIPDATIFTFKELLEPPPRNGPPPGYERYKKHFTGLRPDTQQWLAKRMHSTELAPTRNAIWARLDGFTARGFFHDMFEHPRNKLDLFKELQSSKVILVNTMKGLLKSGTEPFGRYFIARLVQAMEERMFVERGKRLPVFAYIDEASDYIAEEENVEELIDKARKQNMGFIFANQREKQITSSTVRDALSRAAIQARGEAQEDGEPPTWHVCLNRREPMQVTVPNVNFEHSLPMKPDEYDAMIWEMRAKYCTSKDENEPPPPPQRPPERGDNNDPTKWG